MKSFTKWNILLQMGCVAQREIVAVQKKLPSMAVMRPGRPAASSVSFSAAHLRNKFLLFVQRAVVLQFLAGQHLLFRLFVFPTATSFDCPGVTRLPHQRRKTHSVQMQNCYFQSGLRTARTLDVSH